MKLPQLCAFALALSAPLAAHADWFGLHAAAKANVFGGTGDMYTGFDRNLGAGVEFGFTLIGIDFWAEAFAMGNSQSLIDVNVGHQFSFDLSDKYQLDVGLFMGPMFFMFKESEVTKLTIVEPFYSKLTEAGLDVTGFEREFNQAMDMNSDLGRVAAAWNWFRLRLGFEYKLAKLLSVGVEGLLGYHTMISGEGVAAGIKNEAIDQMVSDNSIPEELVGQLRKAVGAREVDRSSLDGYNFSLGIFFKFAI